MRTSEKHTQGKSAKPHLLDRFVVWLRGRKTNPWPQLAFSCWNLAEDMKRNGDPLMAQTLKAMERECERRAKKYNAEPSHPTDD